MEWTTFAMEQGGWGVAMLLAASIGRAFQKGDLVAGREYERITTELERVSLRAERIAEEQREEAARERSRLIDRIEVLQAQVRELQASRNRP